MANMLYKLEFVEQVVQLVEHFATCYWRIRTLIVASVDGNTGVEVCGIQRESESIPNEALDHIIPHGNIT